MVLPFSAVAIGSLHVCGDRGHPSCVSAPLRLCVISKGTQRRKDAKNEKPPYQHRLKTTESIRIGHIPIFRMFYLPKGVTSIAEQTGQFNRFA